MLQRALILVGLVMAVAACADLGPYRTQVAQRSTPSPGSSTAAPDCPPAEGDPGGSELEGSVPAGCAPLAREDGGDYQLYFAEFDDQGWLYNGDYDGYGGASHQIEQLVVDLQQLAANKVPTSVVVFAHGWKHTARFDDPNVRSFRLFLEGLAEVERGGAGPGASRAGSRQCQRRVIGVYLGWRGAATTLGPLENITFWNRKDTAQRVAQGDARVLFAHLRAIQDAANTEWNQAVEQSRQRVARAALRAASATPASASPAAADEGQLDPCKKLMRLSIAGHSFGGLIVYTSLAQALIRDVVELGHAEAQQRALPPEERVRPILEREGDLVVVINPAIEATRLEPLYRAARDAQIEHYNTPTFVSITSEADDATGKAFPVGRWFDTWFAKYPVDPQDHEKQANLRTFGHFEPFLTHHLATLPDVGNRRAPPCEDWGQGDFRAKLGVEDRVLAGFLAQLSAASFDARKLGPRTFCGRLTLSLEPSAQAATWVANSPVWNVRTTAQVIANHNDFDNPLLLALLRQLYVESVDLSVPQARAIQQRSKAPLSR
ncbi:MAG TPA: hypothetical protein VMU47_06905 [Caldimonas sp.]|nr:hypothetical protein [Caldimonas sp.]